MPMALLALSRMLSPVPPWACWSWLRPTLSPSSWPVDLDSSVWRPLQRLLEFELRLFSSVKAYRASLSPVSVKVSLVFCWVLLVESGVSSSLASAGGVSLSLQEVMWQGNRTGGEILAAGVRHDCGCWLLLVGV